MRDVRAIRNNIMDIQIKRIGIVALGSFGVSIAVIIIATTLSLLFGYINQTQDFFFGEWSMLINLIIAAIAYPFLWRYMKVEVK